MPGDEERRASGAVDSVVETLDHASSDISNSYVWPVGETASATVFPTQRKDQPAGSTIATIHARRCSASSRTEYWPLASPSAGASVETRRQPVNGSSRCASR